MKQKTLWTLVVAVMSVGCALTPNQVRAEPPLARAEPLITRDQAQIASVTKLRDQALDALRVGNFQQTHSILTAAAKQNRDPTVLAMANWAELFETQRQGFATERRKQYDKAVEDVKKLQAAGKDDFALDASARAYLLADDKKAFRNEPWVDALVKETVARAEHYEKDEQWLKSLRLYSDLGSIEPANPEWKDRLKGATRRIRLLALYTPEAIKAVQKSEMKEREAVDRILKPTTAPSTQPVTSAGPTTGSEPKVGTEAGAAPDEVADDSFRIDWRETLSGIRFNMLWSDNAAAPGALQDAVENYWRDTSYRDVMIGGLRGLRALVTTRGLDAAFPGLADPAHRTAMVQEIDRQLLIAQGATRDNDKVKLQEALTSLRELNDTTTKIPEEVFVAEFSDGAFSELDPFSSMIWPNDLQEFNKTTQGEFSGVGIQIQSDVDGSLKVVSPIEDSPAYKSGIKAGDIVTHINGKSAKGISLNQAVQNITGPVGTTVTLTVRRPDSTVKDYPIRRETIKVASIKGWKHLPGGGWDYFVDADQKIGYLRLTNFTRTTGDELERAIAEMKKQGTRALILDLRYNPGGLLTAATEVVDKFLHGGVIVSTRADRATPNQPTVATARDDRNEFDLPTIVLVNQYSASASEIVSGALKDQGRALIVGERTFGKGSVQMLFPLEKREAFLKLTTSHYYLPSGRCIHREENSTEWGVDPDVTIEMTPEQMRAAIDARQELDVLRDKPAEGKTEQLRDEAPKVEQAVQEIIAKKKDPLGSDPQLSAALLVLRLQLAGAAL